jgi:DNA recombination protein RmuC
LAVGTCLGTERGRIEIPGPREGTGRPESKAVPLLSVVAIALLGVVLLLQIILLVRGRAADPLPQIRARLNQTDRLVEDRVTGSVRQEIGRSREEAAGTARTARQELTAAVNALGTALDGRLTRFQESADQRSDRARDSIDGRLRAVHDRLAEAHVQAVASAEKLQRDLAAGANATREALRAAFEELRTSNEQRLASIQQENARQLEQMRATVDEKLQSTLEKRLGESFQLVSERLEKVHQGLGEMQILASGVGDLKKVLTNVKTRGTWGEVQLGALIEEVLAPDQFGVNVSTAGTAERVEFAVKLPGRGEAADTPVWLPIDAKFPLADYQRLLAAQELADAAATEAAGRDLETRVKACAADIRNKYLAPPATTDFGILFLPVEGLFSEVIRRPGLCDTIQREYRVVIAGPTTLWAILNSLQLGFRTLAIEKRSSEVWQLLAAVKTEWAKYGEALEKVRTALGRASTSLDQVTVRSRAIGRQLRNVEQIQGAAAPAALGLEDAEPGAEVTPAEEGLAVSG